MSSTSAPALLKLCVLGDGGTFYFQDLTQSTLIAYMAIIERNNTAPTKNKITENS